MTASPLWLLMYRAGALAGYGARCREEAESWSALQSGARVFSAGDVVNRRPAAEVKAERLAIMREAHAAGLHSHRPNQCPLCECPRTALPPCARFVPFDQGAPEHGTCAVCGNRYAAHLQHKDPSETCRCWCCRPWSGRADV